MSAVQAVQATGVHETTVIGRREAAPGIVVLDLVTPAIAASARPGQYVMAILADGGAASVALGIYDKAGDAISLLFFETGPRTKALASLRRGDELALIGPLGNGFRIGSARDVAIVAGGVGIASVLLAARAVRESGARARLFYGARTQRLLVERESFAREGCEIVCATDDGSEGFAGFVTGALLASDVPDEILACGPTPMLRVIAQIARARNVPAQLALEDTFGCGVGGCWGCVVALDQRSEQAPRFPVTRDGVVFARICREGPVFLAEELRW